MFLSRTLVACLWFGCLAAVAEAQEGSKVDPEFAAWYYPGATSPGSSTTLGKLHQTILITPDDVRKIENHYRKLTHDPLAKELEKVREKDDPSPFGIHTSMGYPHPKDATKQIMVKWGDDSRTETDGAQRGVTIRTLVYDTADELVNVTISRTPSEKTTHIVLMVLKKK